MFCLYCPLAARADPSALQNDAHLTPPQAEPNIGPNILSHVTLNDGIDLPKKEEVVLEPTPIPSPDPTKLAPIIKPEIYHPPGRCERNETKRTMLYPVAEENQALYDVIYLSEDLVPLDPDEVFGVGVSLYPYGSDLSSVSYITMRVHGVPCLPYRMRITNAAQYEDFGLNALKNYSNGQAGKGLLDSRMQQKIFGAGQMSHRNPNSLKRTTNRRN
jgi:hypothetical protein